MLTEEGPQFDIDNVTENDEVLRLDDGGRLTDFVLEEGIQLHKERISGGVEPKVLSGTIVKKNLDNFQKEFIMRQLNNDTLDIVDNMDQSIRSISFGKARVRQGYSEFEFRGIKSESVAIQMKDGSTRVIDPVPRKFGIYAKKPSE